MTLTDKEYQVLLDLYNEFNMAFKTLHPTVQAAFYDRLYAK